MAVSLLQEVVLRSTYNNKYLEYVAEEGEAKGFLRFSGEDSTSPQSKFRMEPAVSDSQLVHLRSSYNNKYLRAETETTRWIVPAADGPEEDVSKWSCTLFRPAPVDGEDFRFMHVRTGNYVALMKMGAGNAFDNCLYAALPYPLQDPSYVVTVTELRSVALPRYVAFRGENGFYLGARHLLGDNFLQFSASNSGDKTAPHEVFPNRDGTIRLKSIHFNRFWRVDSTSQSGWVFPDSNDTSNNDKNTLFRPIWVNSNMIGLRSLGKELFCRRAHGPGLPDCLSAVDHSFSTFNLLHVTDLTRSREINNIEFDLTRASKYDEQVVVMGTGEGSNTTDED